MIRALICFHLLILSINNAKAQISDTVLCKYQNAIPTTEVNALIKGKKGKKEIKWKFFYNGVELELTDTSYKIEGFIMTWEINRFQKSMIVERHVKGAKVNSEIENDNNVEKADFSLSTIAPGILITFESIIVRKNGICYKIPPFLVTTVLRKEN